MKRTGMLLLLLLLALPAPAAIYQCRDSKGNLFLTDDPDNLPDDCSREEVTVREEEEERTGRVTPPASQPARELPPAEATAPQQAPQERTESAPREGAPEVAEPGRSAAAPLDTAPEAGREVPAPAVRGRSVSPNGIPGTSERGESAAETGAAPATPDRVDRTVPSGVGTETFRGAEAQAAFEASLDTWRQEAATLGRQYLEAQAAVPAETPAGGTERGELTAADRQGEAQEQINQFLDRLDASPLTPEEKAAIWRELPPEAIQ